MIQNERLRRVIDSIPEDSKLNAKWSFDIADKIASILESRGMTQKEFAKQIGKTETEVSRWLGGDQNFTLKTIAMLSAFFDEPLITVNK